MAIALVAHGIASGVDGATVGPLDLTGANFIVAAVADYTGGPGVTVTDDSSNTYHALTNYLYTAGNMRVRIYYAYNATVDSAVNISSNGTGVYTCIAAAGFSGVKSSSDPYNGDVTGQSEFATFVGASMQTGSVTVAAGDLAIAIEGTPFGQTYTWTPDSGFTLADLSSPGGTEGSGLAYFINSGSSASKDVGWGPSTGTALGAASIATFAAAATASGWGPLLGPGRNSLVA